MLDGTSSEIELLRASMKGQTGAFEVIVRKYQSLVCAITLSATSNLDKSEELAHEAFIRAWTNLAQLEDLAKFRAWLCATCPMASGRNSNLPKMNGAPPAPSLHLLFLNILGFAVLGATA